MPIFIILVKCLTYLYVKIMLELIINLTVKYFSQMVHKLKPFHGAKVCFFGFPDEERQHMAEVLQENGGTAAELEDPNCTHVVST